MFSRFARMSIKFASRPFVFYGELLERYPYTTKSFTSGIMYAAGDLLAQSGENYHKQQQQQLQQRHQHDDVAICSANGEDDSVGEKSAQTTAGKESQPPSSSSTILDVLDGKRAGVFFLFGLCVSGPVMSLWFGFLNELPSTLWRLRQARQSSEILKAYFVLKHHGIDVKLDLAKV